MDFSQTTTQKRFIIFILLILSAISGVKSTSVENTASETIKIRTWVFVIHDQSPARWVAMAKRCVNSCLKVTTLKPVCIFYGSTTHPLVDWLHGHDVEVIFHTPAWVGHIEEAVASEAGRNNVQWSPLYASPVSLVSTFLRIDLPLLLSNEEKYGPLILYTDTDVFFRKTPTLKEFSGQVPEYFIMGTEGVKIQRAKEIDSNAGVMLLNMPNMKKTYEPFVKCVFNEENMNRGLHFGKYGPGDQGAYNKFYDKKFTILNTPLFNWKPYWGWNDDASLIHFHGPKPGDYLTFFKGDGTAADFNPHYGHLFAQCVKPKSIFSNDCLQYVKEFKKMPLD